MATVTYKDASRIYPRTPNKAVNELNLEIHDGEFIVLVGPSGCGKTTSLRMLAGLEPVDEGDIQIDDRSVVRLPPRERDIAMVFQNYALVPAHERGWQSRVRAEDRQGQEVRDQVARGRGGEDARSRGVPGPQARGSCRVVSASAWRWVARSFASRGYS